MNDIYYDYNINQKVCISNQENDVNNNNILNEMYK